MPTAGSPSHLRQTKTQNGRCLPSGKSVYAGAHNLIKKRQVANLDHDKMKLSIQFLTVTVAMAALTVAQAKLGDSGMRHLQSDNVCEICSKDNRNKPERLTLIYKSDGKNSIYQDASKATCRQGTYPTSVTIETTNKKNAMETVDVTDGSIFEISGEFRAATLFNFVDEDISCFIHTSCSVPLVAGDQIGPFVVLEGNDCKYSASPSAQPSPSPTAQPSPSPSTPPTPSPSAPPTATPSTPPTPAPSAAPSITPTISPITKSPVQQQATAPPTTPAPTPACVICSKDDKTRPQFITIEYVPQGVDSEYQDDSKASCDQRAYPTETTLTVTNKDDVKQDFLVQAGTVFTVDGPFDASTEFSFSNASGCSFHTSCSVPLMTGDQIGPFKLLAGNECSR